MMIIIRFMTLLFSTIAFKINRNDQFIIDDDGLRRVWHGVNVIYKTPPFYPPILEGFDSNDSLSEIDLENLISWGMNFIRLYVSWEGVEPIKGQYNTTYLDQIAKIVKMCEKHGVTVLLDAHQDVLSRFFCGEGIPDWAISRTPYKFPFPIQDIDIRTDDEGVPLLEDCLQKKFVMYYFSFDVAQTFQDIFNNKDGVADSFAQFWGFVANYFKDFPNVIGYEIINEPLPGSPYKSFEEFIYPNVGNNANLLPLYQKVSAEIRKYDQLKLVFFESGISDYFGGQFSDSPGGEAFREREVLSYHIYCQLVDDYSVPVDEKACGVLDAYMYHAKENAAKSLKIGKFMTEFGAIVDTEAGNKEINYLLNLMEYDFTSWAYWEFKYYADVTTQAHPGQIESFYDENGQLYTQKVKTLARPYATKICGSPILSYFEPYEINHSLLLKWKISHNCNGKLSQLFLSKEFYFNKFKVEFKNCQGCSISEKTKSYYDIYVPLTIKEGTQVTITITETI